MNLKHITIEVCPTCGAQVIRDTRKETPHTNGEWFETREFGCGFGYEYSPNFRKLLQTGKCSRSQGYAKEKERRKLASDKLVKYIRRMNVDQKFKDKLLFDIKFTIKYY